MRKKKRGESNQRPTFTRVRNRQKMDRQNGILRPFVVRRRSKKINNYQGITCAEQPTQQEEEENYFY